MKPFQMTPVNELVTLTVPFILKITNFSLLPPGAFVFHKHVLFPYHLESNVVIKLLAYGE